MLLMSLSTLLLLCPTCLVRLTWIVFVMGGRWSYSCCFVGCCPQDVFNIARSILVQLPSSFFSIRLVNVHIVHPCSSIDTTADWKKTAIYFIGQVWLPKWPIGYRKLSVPLLVACWCLSRLMRHCFLGSWTYPLVSVNNHLVWRCCLFD